MKLFIFEYKNYYKGTRIFTVIANSRDEAYNYLINDQEKYIRDTSSFLADEDSVKIDGPMLIKINR